MANREIEIKLEVMSDTLIENVDMFLTKRGFERQPKETQRDVYFDTEDYSIINLKRGLRLRNSAGKISFEYKSLFCNENGKFVVEEVNLLDGKYLRVDPLQEILNDRHGLDLLIQTDAMVKAEDIDSYLKSLGLIESIVLNKQRTNYQPKDGTYTISLDEVRNVGNYIEIEINNGDEQKLAEIHSNLLQMEGLILEERKEGYINLLSNSNPKLLSSTEFEQKFQEKYNWNVLPSEHYIVQSLFA